jgi:hypothetical protein
MSPGQPLSLGHCSAINRSAAGVGYHDQQVFYAHGVFFDKTKLPQAVMTGGALATVYDAIAFDVMQQQFSIGHFGHWATR